MSATHLSGVIAGVDGCRIGWVVASQAPSSGACEIAVYRTFDILFEALHDAAVVAIDIPIGLHDSSPRRADVEARRFLGKRGSSVFPAPCRAALAGESYEDASARSYAASGKRLSRQTFGILPKIRDVDRALRATRAWADRVSEVHPETCFTLMNGGTPLQWSKKLAEGHDERLALLSPISRNAFACFRPQVTKSQVASDDILDALAALWTANRIARGEAHTFPSGSVEYDAHGLAMRIMA